MKVIGKVKQFFQHTITRLVIAFSIIGVSIAAVEKQQESLLCSEIDVNIQTKGNSYFINEEDVMDVLTNNGSLLIIGRSFEELNIQHLENKLKNTPFVHQVKMYKDLSGRLHVNIDQVKPIARLVKSRGRDKYIDELGNIIPTSKRHTVRVPLLSGNYTGFKKIDNINETAYGRDLFKLLQFVSNEPLWKAQIAQMDLDRRGNIEMYTQVSKQLVKFGKPENLEAKFNKMEIFYTEILPAKGWNTYKTVNVKFKGQIICE